MARGPQATAEKVAEQFRYDRSRMREQVATEIRAQTQKRITLLNKTEDWPRSMRSKKPASSRFLISIGFWTGASKPLRRARQVRA